MEDPLKKYVLGATRWFLMPREDGQLVPAVAVSSAESSIWVAAYTLLLILIFAAIARLVKDVIIAYFPLSTSDGDNGGGSMSSSSCCSTAVHDRDTNRHAILVGYVNTTDPVSIMILACSYAYTCTVNVCGDGLWGIEWSTVGLAAMLVAVALGQLLANAVGGVLVPGNLRLGNVALVSADSIFFPNFTLGMNPETVLRFNGPAAVRAAADTERTRQTLQGKFRFPELQWTAGEGAAADQPQVTFGYSYNITGYDFGFQRAPSLLYSVEGECHTDYSWLAPVPELGFDKYFPWAQQNNDTAMYVRFAEEAHALPYAVFVPNPDPKSWMAHTRMFGIVPHTAYRLGDQTNVRDPWYYTEPNPDPPDSGGHFRVRARRPVLVCSQNDTWSHGGHSVLNVADLGNLTQPGKGGLKLDRFFWDNLLPYVFGPPSVVTVANSLGYTALASSVQYSAYQSLIDFTATSIQHDLERLVLATLAYSRDVVRNTALVGNLSNGTFRNLAEDATTHRVPASTADYVLSSADVTTLSVRVLIATPVVCVLLWTLIAIRGWVLYSVPVGGVRRTEDCDEPDRDVGSDGDDADGDLHKEAGTGGAGSLVQSEGVRARYFHRAVGLLAVQLNRKLDEQLRGESRWKGRGTFTPFVPDVRVRRRSTRLTSSSTTLSLGPGKSPHRLGAFEPVDLGPAEAAEDAQKRLVAPYVRQAVRPLHTRSSSSPSYVPASTPYTPAQAPYAPYPTPVSYSGGGGGSRSSSGGGGLGGGGSVPGRTRPASEYFPPADSFIIHPRPPNSRPQ